MLKPATMAEMDVGVVELGVLELLEHLIGGEGGLEETERV
jgi:hypothetical protein